MSALASHRAGLGVPPWLQPALDVAFKQWRSHAVLVHAGAGAGQYLLAQAWAAAHLCEGESGRPEALSVPGLACGTCVSCRLILAGTHPDLRWVVPAALQALVAPGAAAQEQAEDTTSSKTRKPSQEIKVEAIRAVVDFSQQTSSRGVGKVVLVYPAERMNLVAANTLLKTLEEPPGLTRFVLLSDALDRLLPTIRSRCQLWAQPPADAAMAVAWLRQQVASWDAEDAASMLAAANGEPMAVLQRLEMGIEPKFWRALPRALAKGEVQASTDWALSLWVESLQKLCHDLLRVAVGATPRFFLAGDLPAAPDLAKLLQWGQELDKLARHADHPWQMPLKLETLLIQARAVLKGAKRDRPVASP